MSSLSWREAAIAALKGAGPLSVADVLKRIESLDPSDSILMWETDEDITAWLGGANFGYTNLTGANLTIPSLSV